MPQTGDRRSAGRRLKEEGIVKVTLVAFSKNEGGNAFWREQEFTLRDDLTYWDKVLIPVVRINT